MMRRLHEEEHGLAGIVLVLVVVWALAAVFMLTRTLIAARQIDNRVGFITHYVSPIDEDLDAVSLLTQTNQAAKEILVSADPLSGQLAEVQTAAQGINVNVREILTTAGTINETVKVINGTVDGIHGNVLAINGNVTDIHASVRGIHSSVTGILGEVRSIEPGVAAINRRADVIIGLVSAIKADTGAILAQVGPGHASTAGGAGIHGHANSIECALPVQVAGIVTGGGNYCNQ